MKYLVLLFSWNVGYREIRVEGLLKKLRRIENSKELKSSWGEYLVLMFLEDIGYCEIRREGLSKKLRRIENRLKNNRGVFGIVVFMRRWLSWNLKKRVVEYSVLFFSLNIGYREICVEGLWKKLRKIENSMLKSSRGVITRRIVEKLKKLRKIENSILKSSQKLSKMLS